MEWLFLRQTFFLDKEDNERLSLPLSLEPSEGKFFQEINVDNDGRLCKSKIVATKPYTVYVQCILYLEYQNVCLLARIEA